VLLTLPYPKGEGVKGRAGERIIIIIQRGRQLSPYPKGEG